MSSRETDVLNYINIARITRTDKLAEELKISESTVRRILERLEKKKKIIRFHGGASAVFREDGENDLSHRLSDFAGVKDSIAAAAAAQVRDGMTIVLLGGTTVSCMCRYLRHKRLTVITNSLLVLNALKAERDIQLVLLGGVYDPREAELRGSLTNNAIAQLGADCLFTGATAFDESRGFLTSHLNSTQFYRECFGSSKKIYMLADSSKLNKPALAVSAHFDEVNCFITDSGLSSELVGSFEAKGLEVIIAGK